MNFKGNNGNIITEGDLIMERWQDLEEYTI